MPQQFDIEGARKAGYSDDEIASHLAQTSGFDLAGAKAAGYSTNEILSHLSEPSQTVSSTPPVAPKKINTQVPGLYSKQLGAAPPDIEARVKGGLRQLGRLGLGAVQYGQYLTGSKVTPTPLFLEPTANPNEALGAQAVTLAPALATAGASLPVQTAAGALTGGILEQQAGGTGTTGAVIGGAIPTAVHAAGEAVDAAGKWLSDKLNAERIFNKVAGVPAGRQGFQTEGTTGIAKTQPGNAAVRALGLEDTGRLGKIQAAAFAKPTPELQVKVAGELHNAGEAIGEKLAQSRTVFNIADDLPLDNTKLQSALKSAGINPGTITAPGHEIGGGIGTSTIQIPSIPVNPTQAHALRSQIGDRITWNPTVVNDANDQLKDAYFALGSKIEQNVPDIGPFNKRWQEDFLYNKALQHRLDIIGTGKQPMPTTEARDALMAALKKLGLAGGGLALGYEVKKRAGF